ncbi:hypothetical protein BKI52_07035 [marine bacterium AO1-C]|nr:hypothetical protein BKI52_07035 [marine bacterium AO1-C]
MQPQEKVIKSFEDKEAKNAFFKELKKNILWALWINPTIILGLTLICITTIYFLGDTKLSFWELFQKALLAVCVFSGLAILRDIIGIMVKSKATLSVSFTENHMILEYYRFLFKSKLAIPYQSIRYIGAVAGEENEYSTVEYQTEVDGKDTFVTTLISLDFWRSLAQKQRLVLRVVKASEMISLDKDKEWDLEELNPGNEKLLISWNQFQQLVQQTTALTLINEVELENYSVLSDEEANNYLLALYKIELGPATYGYLFYDVGVVEAFVPANQDFDVVKEIKVALKDSLNDN